MDDPLWIIAVIIGVAAGWIGEQATQRRHGLLKNAIVGLTGSAVGLFLAQALDLEFAGNMSVIIACVVSAFILVALFSAIRSRGLK